MTLKFKLLVGYLFLFFVLCTSCKKRDDPQHPQNKLIETLSKDTLRIAFLGGSITNGSGASSYEKSWVSRLESHFRKDFNKQIFTRNLGIGASDSEFGVYRFDHVLDFKPDLLVVEFAVNDDQLDSALTFYNHEQLYLLAKKHDIAFLSVNLNKSNNISRYNFIKPVLDYYHLPSVRVKMQNSDLMDGVHPSDNGHLKISSAIFKYLNELKPIDNIPEIKPKNTPLETVSADLTQLDSNHWKVSEESFYYLENTATALNAFDTTRFDFTGTRFGLAVMLRGKEEPQNGILKVKIDNDPWTEIRCTNTAPYRIVKTHTLGETLENKKHRVKIVTVPDTLDDYGFTQKWEIVSVLTAK